MHRQALLVKSVQIIGRSPLNAELRRDLLLTNAAMDFSVTRRKVDARKKNVLSLGKDPRSVVVPAV